MRTTWNGSLSFGLVSIPVGLAPATKPAARQSDVSFRLLHRECATPIKQKRWCPTHDREVSQDELVRGFEVAKGQYLIVEDADLEAIERSDDSRSIEITRFVPEDSVDPVFLDRTYFLVPATTVAQRRPYVLLLAAMLVVFIAALSAAWTRGLDVSCGCFGAAAAGVSHGYAWPIARDVLLLAGLAVSAFFSSRSPATNTRPIVIQ